MWESNACLADSLLQVMMNANIITAPVPDHQAVMLNITILPRKRGAGIWKLNNSILANDTYKKGIKDIFFETIAQYDDSVSKKILWDLCKIRFKEYTIKWQFHSNLIAN